LPLLSAGEPRGVRVVPQATSGFHEYYVPHGDGTGEFVFRLAGGAPRAEKEPTDTTTLADGYITVTPLKPDMTDHTKALTLKAKLDAAELGT
ncbi:MAG TPA: hypothetical protein PLS24_09610, partial [Sedimentisphaerales bacterium]|nr:hypothetical protein [Sedimentisphaerales bacterium]